MDHHPDGQAAPSSLQVFVAMLAFSGVVSYGRDAEPSPAHHQDETGGPGDGADGTAFGFMPFPYDYTIEAINRTHEIIARHGTLYTIQLDEGIPWAEALVDAPFPDNVCEKWQDLAARRPAGHAVYLALAPLAQDRQSLAPATEGSSVPPEIDGAALDDPAVKQAYLNYARRAIEQFDPDFLNLGIEAGELAAHLPPRWAEFVGLYEHVRSPVKAEHPDLQIGISFGLQCLMGDGVAACAAGLIDQSDYVGLSFYPYMSPFHEQFGAQPLPDPPAQWRDPLDWARNMTDKPLAICETGYSSQDVDLADWNLHLDGSLARQKRFTIDLGAAARRDGYLFVVWFIPVDYGPLFERIEGGEDGIHLIWEHVGLLNSDLEPKPAWRAWNRIVHPRRAGESAPESPADRRERIRRLTPYIGD